MCFKRDPRIFYQVLRNVIVLRAAIRHVSRVYVYPLDRTGAYGVYGGGKQVGEEETQPVSPFNPRRRRTSRSIWRR